MIKAVILDDEVKGSSLLMHKLNAFPDLIHVERIFNDPQLALVEMQQINPDILFLDVEMPQMNGFQFLENLGHFDFEVIFVTAYNIYTLDALRVNALDYLLKPVNPDELACALNKLSTRIESKKKLAQLPSPVQRPTQSRLALPTVEGVYFVKKEEIVKIEAMSNYSVFNLSSGSKIIVSKTLKEFESLQEEEQFVRVNRSVIINLDYVVRYRKGDGGTLELIDGSEIEVSSSRKNILVEKLFRT